MFLFGKGKKSGKDNADSKGLSSRPYKKPDYFRTISQTEARASINELERGRVTICATDRLGALAAKRRKAEEPGADSSWTFSSNLSCGELLLTNQAGFQPIAQVLGIATVAVFHEEAMNTGVSAGSVHVARITEQYTQLRVLALNRLMQEAKIVGADGVIDVTAQLRKHDWSKEVTELRFVGTAIRVPTPPVLNHAREESTEIQNLRYKPIFANEGVGLQTSYEEYLTGGYDGVPFLSNISGPEFWKLYQAGYWPTTILGGNYCEFARATTDTLNSQSLFATGANNQELRQFQYVLASAFRQAEDKLMIELRVSGSEGVIGVKVEREYEFSRGMNNEINAMLVNVQILGTGIRSIVRESQETNKSTLTIMDVKNRSVRRVSCEEV